MLSLNNNWDGLNHNQFSHCKKPPSHTSLYRCLRSAAWWWRPSMWTCIHRKALSLSKPSPSAPGFRSAEDARGGLRCPWGVEGLSQQAPAPLPPQGLDATSRDPARGRWLRSSVGRLGLVGQPLHTTPTHPTELGPWHGTRPPLVQTSTGSCPNFWNSWHSCKPQIRFLDPSAIQQLVSVRFCFLDLVHRRVSQPR